MLFLNNRRNSGIGVYSLQNSNVFRSQCSYEGSHNAGNTTHSAAHYRNLGTASVTNIFEPTFIQHFNSALLVRSENGKHSLFFGQVQAADADAGSCQILEQVAACRKIGRIELNTELYQIAQVSYTTSAAFVDSYLAASATATAFAGNQGAGSIAEGGLYIHGDVAAHGKFCSARMNNLGAVVGHLANLSIGNLLQNISLFNQTRVSSHDALNVGVNFYAVSL